jgi:hypothetical protein
MALYDDLNIQLTLCLEAGMTRDEIVYEIDAAIDEIKQAEEDAGR